MRIASTPSAAKSLLPRLVIAALIFVSTNPASAAVLPFTGATFSPDPANNVVADVFDNTTILTSYATTAGTVNALSHAVFANGVFERETGGDGVRNYWGSAGAQIDGVLAVLNLDVSTGVVDAGDVTPSGSGNIDVGGTGGIAANYFFNQDINGGVSGDGNDFFFVELGANDTIDIVPLDAAGSPIGDFTLTIANTDWGQIDPTTFSRVSELIAPNLSNFGGVAFDIEDFTGTGALSGVRGFAISGTTGLDALVIGVNDALAPAPTPTLTINRLTGEATLSNEGSASLQFLGYQIKSEFGALNPANWVTIADEYDATSGGEVDADEEWVELTPADRRDDLSEFVFTGDGGTLTPSQSIPLSTSAGIWLSNPNEEVTGVVMQPDGSLLPITVVFSGNNDLRLLRSDFDGDGDIDALDWQTLNANYRADFENLSSAERYQVGDLTGDGINDLSDFVLFLSDFEAANGQQALSALLGSATPEPTSVALVSLLGVAFLSRRNRMLPRGAAFAALLVCFAMAGQSAHAVVIASEDFESYDAVVGDPGVDFGENGENGGSGWTSAWVEEDNPISSLIRADLLSGVGQGLEIKNRGSSDTNIVTRQFPSQSDDFYVGLKMSTTIDNAGSNPNADDFLKFYLTDSTADQPNGGYGVGTLRADPGPGAFYAQGGDNGGRVASSITQAYGDVYNLVFKFSKSGSATDPFDGIDLWVNQATEGAPDVSSGAGTASLADLSTFHIWFDPRGMSSPDEGNLLMDNLVVATTYDEVATFLDADPTPARLHLLVNSVTGEVTLKNNTTQSIAFKSYELVSESTDTLNSSGWTSLASQSGVHPLVDPVDADNSGTAGDSLGESWAESGVPSDTAFAEQFLFGNTTLEIGEEVSLGLGYDVNAGGAFIGQYLDESANQLKDFDIEFFTPTNLPGDFNDDGIVDAVDYAVWRENLGGDSAALNGNGSGGATVGSADYALWRSSYGNSSNAPTAGPNAAPEPGAFALVALVVAGCLAMRRRDSLACVRVIAPVACIAMLAATDAQAAVTIDRLYSMGDYADSVHFEGQSALNGPAGTDATTTFGSAAVDEFLDSNFADLKEIPSIDLPVYYQLTAGDPGDTGAFALSFDGDDAILTDKTMNTVGLSAATAKSQGMQFWAKPSLAGLQAGERQSLVMDTNNFGGAAIAADGTWTMTSGNQTNIAGVAPVAADAWAHIAMHAFLPGDAANPGGGGDYTTVMYVNGAAVAVNADTNVGTPAGDFTVGGDNISGTVENFYHGVIDDLSAYTSEVDGFNLLEDNTYIAEFIDDSYVAAGKSTGTPYEPGDINLDGDVDGADVTAFVAGWLDENQLVGAFDTLFVGDLNTLQSGDLNLDGQVNLADAFLLHEALAPSGGLDFNLLSGSQAPEPTSAALLALSLLATAGRRRGVR